MFPSKCNNFYTFVTAKEKNLIYGFNIWYTMLYTHVAHMTIDRCNISDIYDIFFIVKEICIFFLEINEEKDPWKSEIDRYLPTKSCILC